LKKPNLFTMKKQGDFVHILFVSFNKNSWIRLGNL